MMKASLPLPSPKMPLPLELLNCRHGPDLQDYLPEGMVILTPVESFGPESLSEKIDGKAELYLSAGFLSLRSQRFVETGKPERWLEVFVYNMGSMRNAFSVYSTQRRADAEDLAFTPFAYQTANACFLSKVSSTLKSSPHRSKWLKPCLPSAESFIQKNPASTEAISEVALFPKASMVPAAFAACGKRFWVQ